MWTIAWVLLPLMRSVWANGFHRKHCRFFMLSRFHYRCVFLQKLPTHSGRLVLESNGLQWYSADLLISAVLNPFVKFLYEHSWLFGAAFVSTFTLLLDVFFVFGFCVRRTIGGFRGSAAGAEGGGVVVASTKNATSATKLETDDPETVGCAPQNQPEPPVENVPLRDEWEQTIVGLSFCFDSDSAYSRVRIDIYFPNTNVLLVILLFCFINSIDQAQIHINSGFGGVNWSCKKITFLLISLMLPQYLNFRRLKASRLY